MKKYVLLTMVTVSIFILSAFSYSQYNSNQQKEQAKIELQKDQKVFDKAMTDFYNKNEVIFDHSKYVLSDYSAQWKLGLGTGSMDFYIKMSKKSHESIIDESNRLYKETTELLKTISKAAHKQPKRYEEVYNECKKQYGLSSALIEQLNNPSGSYISFNQNVNNLLQESESTSNVIKMLISEY